MCDTQVAITPQGTFFAKNSDREPSEPQLVTRHPAVTGDTASQVQTTYVQIPQKAQRFGVILSQPCWMWGAEMGANDQGVVIGNEAVFTKVQSLEKRLLGMDLLRLGLERGSSAEHALAVMVELLATHGQGGPAGYRDAKFHYDNSFIIADHEQVWLLETAGHHWVAKRVAQYAALSNVLTIGSDFDQQSSGLQDFARQQNYWNGRGDFHFANTFNTRWMPTMAKARRRLAHSQMRLQSLVAQNNSGLATMAQNLRCPGEGYHVPRSGSNADICMHAGGPIRRSQTTGSMVSQLTPGKVRHCFTGTSAPCMSIFKPVDFQHDSAVLHPEEQPIKDSLWVRHEQVHRRMLFNHDHLVQLRDSLHDAEQQVMQALMNDDFAVANQLAEQWQRNSEAQALTLDTWHGLGWYGIYWYRLNLADGMNLKYRPS